MKMIRKRLGLILFGVLLIIGLNIVIFGLASGLIVSRLVVKQEKISAKLISLWQKAGWFLKPTRLGGLVDNIPEIIGCNTPKYYFVLLQNRYELRPSGGLMGSYARIKFEKCGLSEIKVEDIYVPDGQIPGHVEPPTPIQTAFQQGWYKLRDANWEIDFEKSAQVISWFFEKGNEVRPDGIMALNFDLILDILKVIGPIHLADYRQEITVGNFYETVQVKVEEDFFPGSTQKRDYLRALETAFMDKIKGASAFKKVQLTHIVLDHLNRGEMLVYSANSGTQKVIEASGWSGKLDYTKSKGIAPICSDYFYSVESNLGANKANRFIERTVNFEINKERDKLIRKVAISLVNNSPESPPDEDPLLYGGDYIDYHRILIPIESEGVEVSVGDVMLDTQKVTRRDFTDSGLSEIGFWVTVEPEQESKRAGEQEINVEYYTIEKSRGCWYRLGYQRQPGTGEYQVVIRNSGNSFFNKEIKSNKVLYRWLK